MVAKQTTSTPQGKPAGSSSGSGSRAVRPRSSSTGSSGGTRGDAIARRAGVTSIGAFVEQSWGELKKVTWPTRQETMNLTVAVITMTLLIAAFLGLIDATLDQIVKVLIG